MLVKHGKSTIRRLKACIISSDSILDLIKKHGDISYISGYYNPKKYFESIVILSLQDDSRFHLTSQIEVIGLSSNFESKIAYYIYGYIFLKKPLAILFIPMLALIFIKRIIQAIIVSFLYDFDIIRVYNPLIPGLIGMVVKKLRKVKLVTSIHSDYEYLYGKIYKYPSILRRLMIFITKLVTLNSDKVIFISKYLAIKYAKVIHLTPEKVRVIYNSVDLDNFKKPADRSTLRSTYRYANILNTIEDLKQKGKMVILYVGRLELEKKLDELLFASWCLKHKGIDHILIIVGDGRLKSYVEKFCNEYLNKACIITGFIEKNVLPTIYKLTDIVVCPISGFVLIEALASGSIVIAANREWHSEIIKNGYNGFIYEISSYPWRNLCHCIANIQKLEPEILSKISANAVSTAMKYFDRNINSMLEVKTYEELCKPK